MLLINVVQKIVRLLTPVWKRAGINPVHLNAILRAKLTMDARRTSPMFNAKRREGTNQMMGMVLINGFLGVLIGFLFFADIDHEIAFLFYHAILLVFFSMLIITEFSTILFDTKDNIEILPRPVNAKTFYASRILHIVIYLLMLGIPLSLGGVLISAFRFNLATALLLFALVLLDVVLAVFISNVFYMGIIRFFSASKLKTILMYVQVLLAVLIYGGYQFVPKLFENKIITEAKLGHQWWLNLIPPYWSAKVSTFFIEGQLHDLWLPMLLNFIFPVMGVWAIVKYFAPFYNRKLSEIDSASESKSKRKGETTKNRKMLIDFLGFRRTEKAIYRFVRTIISKDRKFKQGVYSLVGYAVVLLLLPFMSKMGNTGEFLAEIATSKRYLLVLLIPTILSLIIYPTMQFSEHPESIWLFKFLPIAKPGEFFVASLMITVLNYFLPIAILATVAVLFIWPLSILHHVFLIWGGSLLFLSLFVLSSSKYLPLSRDRNMNNSSQNIGKMLKSFLLIGVFGGIIYGCSFLPEWAGYVIALLCLGGSVLVIKQIRKIAWDKVLN